MSNSRIHIGNQMIDIANPQEEVEIIISPSDPLHYTIWINIDGVCRLRICQVPLEIIKLEDRRQVEQLLTP